MVCGPTGTGKTYGVQRCVAQTNRKVEEINPSNIKSTEQLRSILQLARKNKTLLGPRCVVVEDLEGFDECYLSIIHSVLDTSAKRDAPMVLVCTDPWALGLKRFRSVRQLQLKEMYSGELCACARSSFARNVPQKTLLYHAERSDGNLRQLQVRLSSCLGSSRVDHDLNLFRATRQFLESRIDAEHWMRADEPFPLLKILYENYVEMVDDLNNLAMCSDTMSLAAASSSGEASILATGMAVRRVCPARVGALKLQSASKMCRTFPTLKSAELDNAENRMAANLR